MKENPIIIPQNVLTASQKIVSLNPNTNLTKSVLNLPEKGYGPICLRILNEFIEVNNLDKSLELPVTGLKTHVALGRVFNIILHSMGDERRQNVLRELSEMGFPQVL